MKNNILPFSMMNPLTDKKIIDPWVKRFTSRLSSKLSKELLRLSLTRLPVSHGRRNFIGSFLAAGAFSCWAPPTEPLIEVTQVDLAVERNGITGAGWPVMFGTGDTAQITLHYPNHPDDYGRSVGSSTALSKDGGQTWTEGPDDWPLQGMVDLWQDRLRDGRFVALGIRWLPDPK
jgi:hypothetical protein